VRRYLLFLSFVFAKCFAQQDSLVVFEPAGGIYEAPVLVTLKASPSATIYYTLDGSEPRSGNGESTRKYAAPIRISGVGVIRATAYLNGKRTPVCTQSYFCDRKYTLPVISIAINPESLWDSLTGIYVKGCCADTIEPYIGANYWMSWEKRANIEMYLPNSEPCFNQEAGISIFGGFSRWLPQKSLAVIARSQYGNKKFDYPIFPERDIDKYKSFVIRNSGGDFQRTQMRDAFMTQLAKPTGVAIQAYRPVIVFLNGQYWGIQCLHEKISEHYLKDNYGVDKDNVDILRHNAVARHGTSANYKKLLAFLRNSDMTQDKTIDSLRKFMDVDDYIRYNICEVYSDNRDAGGNIRYWRERTDSAKWRWIFYDLDMGLGNDEPSGYKRNTLVKFTSENAEAWPDPPWSTFIIRSLLKNKKVETQYINTYADYMNTVFQPDTARRLLHKMKSVIAEEMKYHVKRWDITYKTWEYQIGVLDKFVANRAYYCRKHAMEKFGLKDTLAITVVAPGPDVATVRFNSLDLVRPFWGIYFKNVPVKISVIPTHEYEFVGWKGRAEKTSEIEITPTEDLTLEPLFRQKPLSPRANQVVFSEMMISQQDADSSGDWVELWNTTDVDLDLAGWGFSQAGYAERFLLPAGTVVKANSAVIFCQSLKDYSLRFNTDTVTVVGDFGFGLSSKSERLRLYDKAGLIVDSLTYDIKTSGADGSLNLIHTDSARWEQGHWAFEKPSPGLRSAAFREFISSEEDKAYWTKVLYIGGGGFFFILVAGVLCYRYYRINRFRKSK